MSELTKSLAQAQADFPVIPKNREVNAGQRKYKYAELATILAAVTPVLSKNGLAVTQRIDVTDRGPVLITDLRHTGGEVVSSTMPLHIDNLQPQALGSLLTYLKRYSLTSLLNVAADEDDDAHVAQDQERQPSRQTRQPAAAKPNGHANGNGHARSPGEEVDVAMATSGKDPLNILGLPLKDRIQTLEWQLSDAPPAKAASLWLVYSEHVKGIGRPTVYDALEAIVTSKALPEQDDRPNLLSAG